MHWWGKNQVAEKCRSAIRTTFETDLRTAELFVSGLQVISAEADFPRKALSVLLL
jgi:hypothetical protein